MKLDAWVSRTTLAFAGTVTAIIVVFRVLETTVARLGQLPTTAYSEPVFLDNLVARWWGLVTQRVPWWMAMTVFVLGVGVLVLDARVFDGAARKRVVAPFAGWAVV